MGSKLMSIIVIVLVAVVLVLEVKRRSAQTQLEQMTVQMEQLQGGDAQKKAEEAQRIIARVRQLILIPDNIEPTVATIVDIDKLRERNAFYAKAENGDHLIVTPERAILYDPDKNMILDVVPIQLQQLPAGGTETDAGADVK